MRIDNVKERLGDLRQFVVDESFAKRYFPGRSALGDRFDKTAMRPLAQDLIAHNGKVIRINPEPEEDLGITPIAAPAEEAATEEAADHVEHHDATATPDAMAGMAGMDTAAEVTVNGTDTTTTSAHSLTLEPLIPVTSGGLDAATRVTARFGSGRRARCREGRPRRRTGRARCSHPPS